MRRNSALGLFALALLVSALTTGLAVAARDAGAKPVIVKEAVNKKLKKTILVNASGMTLYENTAEQKGKIHCTGSCRMAWPPLLVPAGSKVTAGGGVSQSKLGTLKRSDGGVQVTYRGAPLYRFITDKKAGDVTGQGIKDLGGTWSAAAPAASTAPPPTTTPPPASTPPPPSTDGGYGY